MHTRARHISAEETAPFRMRYREELNCQVVHDSIHRRAGWSQSHLLELAGSPVGFGSVAVGGPWKDRPTLFEFFVLPEHQNHAFALFEAFLDASNPPFFEVQTHDRMLTNLALSVGRGIEVDKILFETALRRTFRPAVQG